MSDRAAALDAQGLTGDPRYAVHSERPGTSYGYSVAAQFEAARGTGRRSQVRPCDLTFVRQ